MSGADYKQSQRSSIRVAMVNTELTRGGASVMAASIVRALNEQCEDVAAVLYHCEDNKQRESSVGLRRPMSRYVNAFLARLGGSYAIADFGVADQIIRNTHDADILHVHNLHGYYLDFERLLSAWQDRPVVWTWHDMWGATGRCCFSIDCEEWQRGCPRCPLKAYYPTAWIDKAAGEFQRKSRLFERMRNLTVVCPSQWLADIAVARGFDESRVLTVPNPVNTDRFQPIGKASARRQLGLPENEFVVLFVASDCGDPRKGYADFVSICECRDDWTAIAVGKPPPQPAEGINHVGVVKDQAALNLHYAAADVMVIPTYADNYPNTIIESLASGTPVMGYDVGGVASQLDMPECVVIPKGDWRSMYGHLDRRSRDGRKAGKLERSLSELAEKRWAPAVAAGKYKTIYEGLLA